MTRETRITLPTRDAEWVAQRLAEAGLTVMDTGERVTTEDGVGAETVLCVAAFEEPSDREASKRSYRLRP